MKLYSQTSRPGRRTGSSLVGNNKGFTLIELAIVLVIIGLILASVLKGKDLINSAKRKQFYNSFVKTWELTVASYYDQTGYLLGDGTINGGTAAGGPNGVFDGGGSGINSTAEFNNITTALGDKGIEIPKTNTTRSEDFSYTGMYSGNQTVQLALINRTNYGSTDNSLVFSNVPIDLAYHVDKIVDGQVDAAAGKCVLDGGAAGATWGVANTAPFTVTMVIRLDIP